VLVGVLALIFVVVLLIQFGGDTPAEGRGDSTRRAASARSARRTHAGPAAASIADGAGRAGRTIAPASLRRSAGPARPWPVVSLEQAVRYDPFATPAPFIARAAAAEQQQQTRAAAEAQRAEQQARANTDARRQEALETLRALGVSAVLSDGREHVALIGSQVVRVGDVVEGFRVVAIGPNGVLLGEPEGGYVPPDEPEADREAASRSNPTAGPQTQADPAEQAQPAESDQPINQQAGQDVSPRFDKTQQIDGQAPQPGSSDSQFY